MLIKGTINKQNGVQGLICDAGSVAMGIDDNNVYHILKTNSNGALVIGGNDLAVNYTAGNYTANNSFIPLGIKPPNTTLVNNIFNPAPFSQPISNLSNVVPNVFLESSTQPNINLYLIRANSFLFNYVNDTLVIGTSLFQPDISLFQDASNLMGFWHNLPMQRISSNNVWGLHQDITKKINLYTASDGFMILATSHNAINLTNSQISILLQYDYFFIPN